MYRVTDPPEVCPMAGARPIAGAPPPPTTSLVEPDDPRSPTVPVCPLRHAPRAPALTSPRDWTRRAVRVASAPYPHVLEVAYAADRDLFASAARLARVGPAAFFEGLAQPGLGDGLVQVCVAGKWVLLVTDAEVAGAVARSAAWDRGATVFAFGRMVGPQLFGVQSGPSVGPAKGLFRTAVGRADENVQEALRSVDAAVDSAV